MNIMYDILYLMNNLFTHRIYIYNVFIIAVIYFVFLLQSLKFELSLPKFRLLGLYRHPWEL